MDRDRILTLLSEGHPEATVTRASLFLGAPEGGRPAGRTDRVRWEHLVDRAWSDALALGQDCERDLEALLAPARRLTDDPAWGRSPGSLAVFLGGERPHTWRLPLPLRDQCFVSDRFHVKPLLPLLHGRGRFFVLAVSRNQARWIVADVDRAWEVEALALPQGTQTLAQDDDPEKTLQLHSGPRRSAGRRDALFHGQGGVGTDDEQVVTQAYCRLIDRAVKALLPRGDRPLVLAGEGALLAQLRRVCSYPRLAGEDVSGSPDRTPVAELHARALPLVRPTLEADQVRASRQFESAGSLALDDPRQVLERAREGRVASLVVASDRERWVQTDPPHHDSRERPEAGDVDLLDLAAAETLRRGGDVYAVPAARVPGGGLVAAVLRY